MKNELKYKWIVYITVNKINGKFYIGYHKTLDPQTWDHYIGCGIYSNAGAKYLKKKGKNCPFINAVVKYGYEKFKRTTLRVFDNESDALQMEKELVTETLLKSKECYNATIGGKACTWFILQKRVFKFDLNGNFLQSYKSIKLAADSCGLDQANLVACLQGRQHTCGGFYWNYEKKFEYNPYTAERKICQYDLSGNFIKVWDSIKEAKIAFQTTAINRAIKNKTSAAKFQWRYFTGSIENISPYKTVHYKCKDDDIV